MNFNTDLKTFLNENLLNDLSCLAVDLPNPSIYQYVDSKASEYSNTTHMLSNDDLVTYWGSIDNFQIWKTGVSKQAVKENELYLLGRVDSLVMVWSCHQRKVNDIDPDDLEHIDSKIYVSQLLNIRDEE